MGTPWVFNDHLLLFHELQMNEDPRTVLLYRTAFWIQIHDLPPGLMSESLAKRFGIFLGEFLDYDTRIPTMGFQQFMRIRVRIDVRLALKRKKKIQVGAHSFYAHFQYERLSLFCFICDLLGHGEIFCPLRVKTDP